MKKEYVSKNIYPKIKYVWVIVLFAFSIFTFGYLLTIDAFYNNLLSKGLSIFAIILCIFEIMLSTYLIFSTSKQKRFLKKCSNCAYYYNFEQLQGKKVNVLKRCSRWIHRKYPPFDTVYYEEGIPGTPLYLKDEVPCKYFRLK